MQFERTLFVQSPPPAEYGVFYHRRTQTLRSSHTHTHVTHIYRIQSRTHSHTHARADNRVRAYLGCESCATPLWHYYGKSMIGGVRIAFACGAGVHFTQSATQHSRQLARECKSGEKRDAENCAVTRPEAEKNSLTLTTHDTHDDTVSCATDDC